MSVEMSPESVEFFVGSNLSQETKKTLEGFSNVDEKAFRNTMNQLKYSFIYDTEFHSFSHLFPYDTWNEPINYPLVCSRDKHLDEAAATPIIVENLAKVLNSELKKFDYKIEDVHSGNRCKFTISLPYSHRGIKEMKVCTNAVIVPNSIEDEELASNVCIGLQFKKPTTIFRYEAHQQLLLTLIGALSLRSNENLPILFVSTDLDTFKFVWLPDQKKRIIHFFETRNFDYSISIIKKLIVYHHSIVNKSKPIIFNRPDQIIKIIDYFKTGDVSYFKTQEDRDLFNSVKELFDYGHSILKANEPLIHESNPKTELNDLNDTVQIYKLKKAKIQEVYKKLSQEGKLTKLKGSRTKFVYKIEIDNKPYVLKITNDIDIYTELVNEEAIYKYLSYLRKEIGNCFPELYYAGHFLSSHYAIVTSYIEGRHPSWDNECDRMLCERVLGKINNAGVLHGDARTANFIITEKQQHKDKNGQFVAIEDSAIILDFGFSEKYFIRLKENLKND